jgi:hypothetical protein
MNNWFIYCFSRIFILGILIFKWLTARRLYKSFGVKELGLSNLRYVMLVLKLASAVRRECDMIYISD